MLSLRHLNRHGSMLRHDDRRHQPHPLCVGVQVREARLTRARQQRPLQSSRTAGDVTGGDGGNRTPVQWPAPNSSPSAVYGFISQPPALRRHTAG